MCGVFEWYMLPLFFFKQRTAYEMRISDWSSDVCSSDLAAARREERLVERLPPVRGRLSENAPLAGITWFRVGGAAEIMFRPADREDLLDFLAAKPADVAVTVIGVGSNLLVRAGGVPGIVITIGRASCTAQVCQYV